MDLQAVSDALVSRINDNITSDYRAEAWPDDDETFQSLSAHGCVLVRLNDFTFSEPEENPDADIIQTCTQEWQISTIVRSITDPGGSYDLIENIRQALTGFEITALPGSTKFYPVAGGLDQRVQPHWKYDFRFTATFLEYGT